ncbi:MAG: HAD-IIIA family hydrolase [Actinobacteria bacterium]|uniref:D,D-heptose 1,7-bisphosphate phosphatase n=1 Tax=freshwater metagenome TaxID=449393 RepID=A0A6J5ZMZ5_9ZZZZ|nr:HAD-IIIA family hydrolase [Actinomycetota bacterium]
MRAPVTTVFLDRDGVINRKLPEGEYVGGVEEFEPLPGAIEAIAEISRSGLRVVVVTNQQGVGKGIIDASALDLVHAHLTDEVEAAGGQIEQIQVCPHLEGSCNCRKPATGLFEQARAQNAAISFAESVVIGDSPSDIEAAGRIGAKAIRVAPAGTVDADAAAVVPDLASAAGLVLGVARV